MEVMEAPWSEWAHDVTLNQATKRVPATLVTEDFNEINQATREARAESFYQNTGSAVLNRSNVAPSFLCEPVPAADIWQIEDEGSNQSSWITDPSDPAGLLYKTIKGYVDMPFEDAKLKAMEVLEVFTLTYRADEFKYGTQTFSAGAEYAEFYRNVAVEALRDPLSVNGLWLLDVKHELLVLTDATEWWAFWAAFYGLVTAARTEAKAKWDAILALGDTGTTDQIRQIMADLPELPSEAA